jgi:hypothetical protein
MAMQRKYMRQLGIQSKAVSKYVEVKERESTRNYIQHRHIGSTDWNYAPIGMFTKVTPKELLRIQVEEGY